jgi:hypothetical protein
MKIEDPGEYVEFWLLGVNHLVDQIPWASVVNGVVSPWMSFRLEPNVAWQKVTTIQVLESQTITFRLGASGDVAVGGPTDFSVDIERAAVVSSASGYARIEVNGIYYFAIPYINDNGEWKQAESWGKLAGLWNPAG